MRSTNSNPAGASSPGSDVPDTPNGEYPESDSDTDTDTEDEGDSADSKEIVPTTDAGTAGKESKACEEISNLVNYVTPVRFKSFHISEQRRRSFEMSSFDEKFAANLLKGNPFEFVKYNKFQTSRIYPKGTRYIDTFSCSLQNYTLFYLLGLIAPITCPTPSGMLAVSL